MPQAIPLLSPSFVPHVAQKAFYEACLNGTHEYVVYMGGWGAGKSRIGCEAVWMLALMYADSRIAILRNTIGNCTGTTMDTLFSEVMGVDSETARRHPYVESWNRNTLQLVLKNRTRIHFLSLGEEKRSEFGSWPFSVIYVDEAQEMTEEQFTALNGRLRWKGRGNHPIPRRFFLMTGTPSGRNWIYQKFYRNPSANKAALALVAKTHENIANLPKSYIENRLELMVPSQRKRFLDADFGAFEGQVFDCFDRTRHVQPALSLQMELNDIRKRGGYELYRTIDLGAKAPWCCLWATYDTQADKLRVEKEYLQAGLALPEHCRNIVGLSTVRGVDGKAEEEERLTLCDTQMFSTDTVTGKTLYSHLAENGIMAYGVDKDIHLGILRMQDIISQGKLVVSDACPELIDALEGIVWDKRTEGSGREKPVKNSRDHPVDALRYLIMSIWPTLRPVSLGAATDEASKDEALSWAEVTGVPLAGGMSKRPAYPIGVAKRYGNMEKRYAGRYTRNAPRF